MASDNLKAHPPVLSDVDDGVVQHPQRQHDRHVSRSQRHDNEGQGKPGCRCSVKPRVQISLYVGKDGDGIAGAVVWHCTFCELPKYRASSLD